MFENLAFEARGVSSSSSSSYDDRGEPEFDFERFVEKVEAFEETELVEAFEVSEIVLFLDLDVVEVEEDTEEAAEKLEELDDDDDDEDEEVEDIDEWVEEFFKVDCFWLWILSSNSFSDSEEEITNSLDNWLCLPFIFDTVDCVTVSDGLVVLVLLLLLDEVCCGVGELEEDLFDFNFAI